MMNAGSELRLKMGGGCLASWATNENGFPGQVRALGVSASLNTLRNLELMGMLTKTREDKCAHRLRKLSEEPMELRRSRGRAYGEPGKVADAKTSDFLFVLSAGLLFRRRLASLVEHRF